MGFSRWEGCQTKLVVKELNGIEIELPELEDSTFDLLIEQSMPYSLATEDNGVPFGDYLLVSAFLDRARLELQAAGVYLGLTVDSGSKRKTK
jgi:hypothetical protein